MVLKYVVEKRLGNFRRDSLASGSKMHWLDERVDNVRYAVVFSRDCLQLHDEVNEDTSHGLEWVMAGVDRRAVGCPIRRPHKRFMSRYTSYPLSPSQGSEIQLNSLEWSETR